VDVIVQSDIVSPVNAVQIYPDFNYLKLEVDGVNGGNIVEQSLHSSFANRSHEVDYAAGTLNGEITLPFILSTLDLRAKAATGPGDTLLLYARLVVPRQTRAIDAALINIGMLTPAAIVLE